MTIPSSDTPPADVPEADWVEQAVDAGPLSEEDIELESAQAAYLGRGLREVDDADLAEQETPAYSEDDDARR
jgi:hypothetical protein